MALENSLPLPIPQQTDSARGSLDVVPVPHTLPPGNAADARLEIDPDAKPTAWPTPAMPMPVPMQNNGFLNKLATEVDSALHTMPPTSPARSKLMRMRRLIESEHDAMTPIPEPELDESAELAANTVEDLPRPAMPDNDAEWKESTDSYLFAREGEIAPGRRAGRYNHTHWYPTDEDHETPPTSPAKAIGVGVGVVAFAMAIAAWFSTGNDTSPPPAPVPASSKAEIASVDSKAQPPAPPATSQSTTAATLPRTASALQIGSPSPGTQLKNTKRRKPRSPKRPLRRRRRR